MTQPAFPLRGVLAPLALVLVLGIGLFAVAEVTVSAREPLLLQVGEQDLQVRVGPESISGGGLQLRRAPGGLKGTLRGLPVDLRWNDAGNISGQAAGVAVDLVARPRSGQTGLDLTGRFGEDPSRLMLSPTFISGSVGGCSYSLAMAGNRYSGWRTCGATQGPPAPVTLRIPDEMVPLARAEEGALLSLLLSAETLPPAPSTGETPGQGGAGTPSP